MSESSIKTILIYRFVGKLQFLFSGRAILLPALAPTCGQGAHKLLSIEVDIVIVAI